jgi:hypothetical protein
MQIDAAVESVLLLIEAHTSASFRMVPGLSPHRGWKVRLS